MIYILTAVHNDIEDTKKLLKSVYTQTLKNFEVFLVDDGSTDGTSNFIKEKYSEVNLIKGDGNLWWTKSLNLGLKRILEKASKNDFVWIINNDCTFGKTLLSSVSSFAAKHKSFIIGSLVLDKKTKRIWDRGVKIDWSKLNFSMAGTDEQIDALSTKGTLYPVRVFKEIGLFDAKHFPHYFSDYEFSIRAGRAGYKLIVCPASKVYNRIERTGTSKLSFSKKSTINPVLQLNLVLFVCPQRYRLKAFFLLISKLFYGKR